jgi:hypothetical protein
MQTANRAIGLRSWVAMVSARVVMMAFSGPVEFRGSSAECLARDIRLIVETRARWRQRGLSGPHSGPYE